MNERPLLLLARHGKTAGNQQHIFRSRMNFPLNDEGVQDAHELGEHVKQYKPDVIISSPMARASQTAQVVSQHTGAPVERDSRLLPWHAGLLAGKPRNVKTEAVRDFYVRNAHIPIPGGESIQHSEERMRGILEAGLKLGAKGKLALFSTHGSGIKAAETLVTGRRNPTGDAAMIEPGGLAGIFATGNGLEMRPLFKGGSASVTS